MPKLLSDANDLFRKRVKVRLPRHHLLWALNLARLVAHALNALVELLRHLRERGGRFLPLLGRLHEYLI